MRTKKGLNGFENIMSEQLLRKAYESLSQRVYTPRDPLAAFRRTSLDNTKVVVIGQSPYPVVKNNWYQATGVALESRVMTPTLHVWYDEMDRCYNTKVKRSSNLQYLCDQGVLLLNAELTCSPNQVNTHHGIWNDFMKDFIVSLSTHQPIVFVLMGKRAQSFHNKVYSVPYNSRAFNVAFPINYNNTQSKFIGSNIFIKVNDYLNFLGLSPVVWNDNIT